MYIHCLYNVYTSDNAGFDFDFNILTAFIRLGRAGREADGCPPDYLTLIFGDGCPPYYFFILLFFHFFLAFFNKWCYLIYSRVKIRPFTAYSILYIGRFGGARRKIVEF